MLYAVATTLGLVPCIDAAFDLEDLVRTLATQGSYDPPRLRHGARGSFIRGWLTAKTYSGGTAHCTTGETCFIQQVAIGSLVQERHLQLDIVTTHRRWSFKPRE